MSQADPVYKTTSSFAQLLNPDGSTDPRKAFYWVPPEVEGLASIPGYGIIGYDFALPGGDGYTPRPDETTVVEAGQYYARGPFTYYIPCDKDLFAPDGSTAYVGEVFYEGDADIPSDGSGIVIGSVVDPDPPAGTIFYQNKRTQNINGQDFPMIIAVPFYSRPQAHMVGGKS